MKSQTPNQGPLEASDFQGFPGQCGRAVTEQEKLHFMAHTLGTHSRGIAQKVLPEIPSLFQRADMAALLVIADRLDREWCQAECDAGGRIEHKAKAWGNLLPGFDCDLEEPQIFRQLCRRLYSIRECFGPFIDSLDTIGALDLSQTLVIAEAFYFESGAHFEAELEASAPSPTALQSRAFSVACKAFVGSLKTAEKSQQMKTGQKSKA